jgi:hypothetical protein
MINATKDRLANFFQGNSQFIVPFFQRSYVWDEDNWTTLWDHILSVYESCANNVTKEHFIGTIITKQRPAQSIGEAKHDLIDGQQRLTTIALFLKAISDASSGQMTNLKAQVSGDLRFQDARGKFYSRIVPVVTMSSISTPSSTGKTHRGNTGSREPTGSSSRN